MNKEEHERLNKTLQIIEDKYKNNNLLYQKIEMACYRLERSKYINPKPYKELAKLTAKIDYQCYFKNGKCKKNRTQMCCCSQCVQYFGHIKDRFFRAYDREEFIEEEILYYVKKFSLKTGFWRKGKGCILPRERRSSTCLTYNCKQHQTNEEHLLFSLLSWKWNKIECISHIVKMLKDYFLYREE